MQAQTTRTTKRSIKRRNRNKRRRKARKQQKNAQNIEGKNQISHKKLKPQQQQQNIFSPDNGKWEALCLETYQRLTSWQCEAELNFWKARAEFLQKENKQLKQELSSRSIEKEKDEVEVSENETGEQRYEAEEDESNLLENCNVDSDRSIGKNEMEAIENETGEERPNDEEGDERNLLENCDVDPGYLEFIAITHKHREDLKRIRATKTETAKQMDQLKGE